jgi:NAD(P)H-hydrate epimerase
LNVAAESDFQHFPRPRTVTSHKGTFGHLAIVAGSLGYHGAAVLASRGAQRAQPGLITVITSSNAYVPVASQCQAVMVHRYDDTPSLPEKCSAVLAGPGLAGLDVPPELPTFVRELWQRSDLPVIVDASGLPWLAKGAAQTKAPRVITPHPGEAARLLGTSSEAIQSDRVGAVRKLSSQYGGCYVVLKGHQTIIGKADGPLSINNSGNPYLGQGGTGDLLAGYLAGFLAQPALQKDVVRTISFAVWQHGHAADELSATRSAWVVEDLAEHLGRS